MPFACAAFRQPQSTRVLNVLVFALTAAACGGDGGTTPEPIPQVASVAVAGTATVEVGKTVTLTATALSEAGTPMAGQVFTWASSNETVATVSNGTVTGVAPGTATISATAAGKRGELVVSVTAVPVGSVAVTPDTATIAVGATRQLSAAVRDPSGGALTGRAVTWASSDTTKARVSSTGQVTGVAAGTATITASSEGKQGQATVTVVVPAASRVAIDPLFATLDPGQTTTFGVSILNQSGQPIQGATATWTSLNTNIAMVDPTSGRATAVAVGQARIVAQSGTAADTTLLVVLGTRSVLSTAFARQSGSVTGSGVIRAIVTPGQTITVPVTLDLRRASANGDLGAVQFELSYDAAVLEYQSVTAGVSGSVETHLVEPGKFRYAFVSTNPQQQNAALTLATVTFRVAANAAVGTQRDIGISYPQRPVDTSLNAYEAPTVVGGRIRVVAP